MNPDEPSPPVPPRNPLIGGLEGLVPGEMFAMGLNTVQPPPGTQPWTPPTPEELAALLPQYGITALLGSGGMGAVYRGVQSALDRPVAIKLLPADMAAEVQFVERFRREARTLAKLQHSGIVAVHDFGQTSAGHLYFVMEYVEGTDLQRILHGPGLDPAQALSLISQICDALHYAHRQDVIHRDIKPANILVTKDGRAKVADFGLARPLKKDTSNLTSTKAVMGTDAYMAPEQRKGQADERADIYPLGVMLYEMLTGERPHGVFAPPSHKVEVDVRLDEVVLKALQEEPDRRYQHASEMKTDVDHIRTTPAQGPAIGTKRATSLLSNRRALAAVAMIALFAIAGVVIWKKAGLPGGSEPNVNVGPASRMQTDPDHQRHLAVSVISKGGDVAIWVGEQTRTISRSEDLPQGRIELAHVDQTRGDFTDADSDLLAGCQKLRSFRLHGCSMSFIPFESLPALQSVELVGSSHMTSVAFKDLPKCGNLSVVNLVEPAVDGQITRILAQCQALDTIELHCAKIANADLLPLAGLKRLRVFGYRLVGGQEITTEAGLEVLARMESLEQLRLGVNLPEGKLSFLPQMKNVTSLVIKYRNIPKGAYASIAAMPSLESLEAWVIDSHRLPNITDDDLHAVLGNKRLERVSFVDTKITAEGFANMPPLPRMKEVNIIGNPEEVSEAGVNALLKACPNLKLLNLSARRLTADAAAVIAAARSLRSLSLRDADGLDQSWIAHLASMNGLTLLDLSDSPLTDSHVSSLENLKSSLTVLRIANTQITDASIETLKKFTALKTLEITDTKITKQGAETLRQALVGCDVRF